MSYYEEDRRRYKSTRERPRRDDYEDDSTAYNTRDNLRTTTMVRRRDDSPDSIEEVTRDFPPGERGAGYYRETTVRKSGTRPTGRSRSYDNDRHYDDRYDDRYGRRDTYVSTGSRRSKYDDRRDRRRDDYSDGSSRSRTPPRKERRKSMPQEALEALGLGGVLATLTGKKKSRSRSRDRDRDRARSRSGRDRSRSSSRTRAGGKEQLAQALKAAVLAGAGEAFRARHEPGGWGGEKGKRVLTAAFSAGGVDGLISNNRDSDNHSTRDTIGSAIAGMATSRLVNGPRSKSRGRSGSPNSRRGRSESRGGKVGDLAAGGVLAATAKKIYDSVSKSRERSRGRSPDSYDSRGSRSPPRKNRSRSLSRAAGKGLAAIGLGSVAEKVDPSRRRSSRRYSDDDYDDRSGYHGGNGGYDYGDSRDDVGLPRSGSVPDVGRTRSMSQLGSPDPQHYSVYGPHHTGDPETDTDSDIGSSSDEDKEHKQGRKRQIIGASLATVATIHAGHSVYQSVEKRKARKRAVREGKISPEEAKKNQNRDRLQDAASIGLAALGIKGAYSEWKEMRETTEEIKQNQEKFERHRAKREARREKLRMLEQGDYVYASDGRYSNSMPHLPGPPGSAAAQSPYYGDPRSSAVAGPVHYYDDNPYAGATFQQLPPERVSTFPTHSTGAHHGQ